MLSKWTFLFTILFFLIAIFSLHTFVMAQVVINEVLPDPTASLDKSEWIELYNDSDESVDISGWDIDGKVLPVLEKLSSQGFLIVTKDIPAFTSEFGQLANLIALDISLTNSGDTVKLGNKGVVVDQFTYTSSTPGRSWERRSAGCNLIDLHPESHSLNKVNSNQGKPCEESAPPPTPQIESKDLQISEVFPSPNSSVGEKEWVELYNFGTQAVSLQGWKLQDTTKTMTLPSISISPNSHMLITDLKISLNNHGETISLLAPDGSKVDAFTYDATDKQRSQIRLFGQNKYDPDVKLTLSPTPGAINVLTAEPPKVVVPKTTKTEAEMSSEATNAQPQPPTKVWALPNLELQSASEAQTEQDKVILELPAWKLCLGLGFIVCLVYVWKVGLLRAYISWWQADNR